MTRKEIDYVQERVMRSFTETGAEQFAIYDVYFAADGSVATYTEDALSPRAESVSELKAMLLAFVEQGNDEVISGDLGYTYSLVDIEQWLKSLEYPPLEYDS